MASSASSDSTSSVFSSSIRVSWRSPPPQTAQATGAAAHLEANPAGFAGLSSIARREEEVFICLTPPRPFFDAGVVPVWHQPCRNPLPETLMCISECLLRLSNVERPRHLDQATAVPRGGEPVIRATAELLSRAGDPLRTYAEPC